MCDNFCICFRTNVGLYDRQNYSLKTTLGLYWGQIYSPWLGDKVDYGRNVKPTFFSRSKDLFILYTFIIAKLSDWIPDFWNKLKLLLDRIGLLDKPPAGSAFLPSRASSRTRFPTLLTPPTPVWSNTSVVLHNLYCVWVAIKRKLAEET
jgi:hypothetical protein